MQVFTRVVDTNSFSRAADTLNLPRASVTTIIQNLEAFLNVRLLQRTTRRLNLTPDGAAYYERCVRILADIEEAEGSFATSAKGPRGKLRVDMPGAIGRNIVMPAMCEFHTRYPDIELMVGFGDKPVDLIQEGVDCVIRVGTLQDSSLVARRIGVFQGLTAAAPQYLERHGVPKTIEDLEHHTAVNYFSSRTGRVIDMDFVVDEKTVEVKMRGMIAVNDAEAYLSCGVKGVGLIQVPRFMALPFLQTGELVEVLPQWKPCRFRRSIRTTGICRRRCACSSTGRPNCSNAARCSPARKTPKAVACRRARRRRRWSGTARLKSPAPSMWLHS
jgi:LysR family transcriptional regulator for bpeEF and oprC